VAIFAVVSRSTARRSATRRRSRSVGPVRKRQAVPANYAGHRGPEAASASRRGPAGGSLAA
jgi:hypothetical protein